jgi:hypothetical protein
LKLENKKQRLSPKLGQSSGCESLLRVRAAESAGAVNFCIELANTKKRIRLRILFMD